MTKLTASDMKLIFKQMRDQLSSGKSHSDIADSIGLDIDSYATVLKRFFAEEADELKSRSPEQAYIEYVLAQKANITDLTELLAAWSADDKQRSASVSAIKVRADIVDKVFERGQDLGYIPKAPSTKIVGSVALSQSNSSDLRSVISRELAALTSLSNRIGGQNIIDVEVRETHFDDDDEPAPTAKQLALPEVATTILVPSHVRRKNTNKVRKGGRKKKRLPEVPL